MVFEKHSELENKYIFESSDSDADNNRDSNDEYGLPDEDSGSQREEDTPNDIDIP